MNKIISTYDDLVAEKARLRLLLQTQEEQIREDIREIKNELKPLGNAVSAAALFVTRSTNGAGLAGLGLNVAIDVLFNKFILSKAGWITRRIIPYLVKNYTSHIVDEPQKFLHSLKNLFRKKDHTGMDAV